MEELKKELETVLAKYIGFEDVVVCLYDLIDSMDKNKFRCSECYIEEKDR